MINVARKTHTMPTSTGRNVLLRPRLARMAPLLRRLEQGDPLSIPLVRVALWRLREVLPVLQLGQDVARKLGRRLRQVTRWLGKVRELDAQLVVIDDLAVCDRRVRPAAVRVKHEIRRRRVRLGADALQNKAAADFRRTLRKLASILEHLHLAGDTSAGTRAIGWAVKARMARRAATLKQALGAAGGVYGPGRLREVRLAARKLRFGAELLADIVGGSGVNDLRPVEQMQEALDRLRYTERLIRRVRRLQGALAPPDLKAWQELDAVIANLEDQCRRLHARYVRERPALVALCDRLGARASAPGAPKRKAS
jgi:CHAD domain-containing protein